MTEKEKGVRNSHLEKGKSKSKVVKKEKPQQQQQKATKPQQYTDEQYLNALKSAVEKNDSKPATSRQISDALGVADAEVGRALVRRAMERLITEGKVKSAKPSEGVRAGKVYSLPA